MKANPKINGKEVGININATPPVGSINKADNGLNSDSGIVMLGGNLIKNTTIKTNNYPFFINGALNSGIKVVKFNPDENGNHQLKIEDTGAYCHNINTPHNTNKQDVFNLPSNVDANYGNIFHFYNAVSSTGLWIGAAFPMSIHGRNPTIWTSEIGATCTFISVDNRYWILHSWTGKWNFNS